jgi:hypothetical protein
MSKAEFSVRELVNMIERQALKLPEMQRAYVWKSTRVRDLLDSLYRGYPSGIILMWQTDDEVATTEFAVKTSSNEQRESYLLLDGQQRLTSLSSVLRGEPVQVANRQKPIDILFNLDHPEELQSDADAFDAEEDSEEASLDLRFAKRTFVVSSNRLAAQPHWVPVSQIFQKSSLELLRGAGISDMDDPRASKYSQRIERVKAIENYVYRVDVLDRGMSYQEVTEIFVRVNSLGAKLRSSDLALAQITAKWNGALGVFTDFQGSLRHRGFGLDLSVVLRTMVALISGQSEFASVNSMTAAQLDQGWSRTTRAMNFAINFLESNLRIDSPSLLSSPFLVTAIAYWIDVNGYNVSESQSRALEKWARLANAKGRYSKGATETMLNQDLLAMREGDWEASLIQRLRQQVGRLSFTANDLLGKSARSGEFKTLFSLMRERGARDWATGLAIGPKHGGKTDSIEFHHIFPKAMLKRERPELQDRLVNDIANLAFIGGSTNRQISSKGPSQYRKGFDQDLLKVQFVDFEKLGSEANDYESFVAQRRAELANALNSYLGVDEGD